MFAAKRMKNTSAHFFAEHQKKVKQLIATGKDVICLDIGSPDMPPSKEIIETLCRSASDPGAHGYQAHNGTSALREAWSEMYLREFDVIVDPGRQVLPLLGTKEGIFHLMQALVDPGDIVLLPDPGYPTYLKSVQFAGGNPFFMPLSQENGFLPDLTRIPPEIANKARIMWLNYPNNPTAATAPYRFYQDVVSFAQKYNILICHDAAYARIYFDDSRKPVSLLQVPEAETVGVEFNSLSKTYNMAGWRLGAVLGNKSILKTLLTLKTNLDSGHFLPVLQAATTALSGNQTWVGQRNEIYRARRDIVVDSLLANGFTTRRPDASFYVWAKIPGNQTAKQFVDRLLSECSISVTPGTVFGEGGEGYIRIALSQPADRLQEAMQRIEASLDALLQ